MDSILSILSSAIETTSDDLDLDALQPASSENYVSDNYLALLSSCIILWENSQIPFPPKIFLYFHSKRLCSQTAFPFLVFEDK